ncbi:MAG TPA: redox-sensing transcriptional repressor Rex [Firmicutes bacterium]|nr:redox-sensing transcriptional repressor Rex [Bacillota bacterium]
MRWHKISDAVVRRLPLYLRVLEEASRDEDKQLMSSQELGDRAGVAPALVRKDLAWFGEFGKQGVGYQVDYLKTELRRILNLDREIRVGLVGVGALGHALVRYHRIRSMRNSSFHINLIALFDNDPAKFGEHVVDLEIWPLELLAEKIKALKLEIIIVTVPAAHAQEVVDLAVAAGIKAILNFAPVKLTVPEGVHLANADLSLELQRLAYYLNE